MIAYCRDRAFAVIDFSRDHFALFGLPRRFRLDADALDRAYRQLQGEVHPDRFASGDDAQKRLASQSSARVNEAYAALKNPVSRAQYLLWLEGIDAGGEMGPQLPVDFLERQLERREAANNAVEARDQRALDALLSDVRADAREMESELLLQFDGRGSHGETPMRVRELMFLAKLIDDLDAMQSALDSEGEI